MNARFVLASMLRESRGARGRMLFFALSLAVGVAAVVGVSGLVGAIQDGIAAQSRRLLAADFRVSSRAPFSAETFAALDAELLALGYGDAGDGEHGTEAHGIAELEPNDIAHREADIAQREADVAQREAGSEGLDGGFERASGWPASRARVRRADVCELTSMASAGASRLVEIKSIGPLYPFYGELATDPPDARALLDAGTALVAPELATALDLEPGDDVQLGSASFRVAGIVLDEPDRLEFSVTLGPRVFLTSEGLDRTGLLQFGSRVRYRMLFELPALDSGDLEALEERLDDALEAESLRIETRDEAQENVREGLERVGHFLGLVALLSLVLGGVGVAQIVRAWLAERTAAIAVLRCIGFRPREILALFLAHVLLLAFAASVVGAAVGACLPAVAPLFEPEFLSRDIVRAWQPGSIARGLGLGLAVAALFALPPLTAVWRVSPARVLRAEAEPLPAPRWVRLGSPTVLALGLFATAWVQAGDLAYAAAFSGGLAALAAALAGAAALVVRLARRVDRRRLSPHLVHGISALGRPAAGTVGAIVALGLGVLVVVAMFLVQDRLDRELAGALPADAPTVFMLDIQPDQWDGVRAVLAEEGALTIDSVPVVSARLASIDGRSVDELAAEREDGRRKRWVLTREQRLTWMDALPEDNRIVAGGPWGDPEVAEISIEEDFAEDLGVGVGARLAFDVQGVPVEFTVSSLRTVEWESFAINFFLVAEPGALDGAPHYRLATAQLEPAGETRAQDRLAEAFPNVTVLRVRPILEKVRAALTKLALGVRTLGSFTILVGIAVLAGAVSAGGVRRAREAALLKTLGLTRRGVAALFCVEYALVGIVAGAIGALGAYGGAWLFLDRVVELEPKLPLFPFALALVASALFAATFGVAASARALAARPLMALRG